MRIVTYSPDRFEALASAAAKFSQRTRLDDLAFVDFYYASSDVCRLHLALNDKDEVLATLGIEMMPFVTDAGPRIIGAGSNFHSLSPGVGGLLFHLWLSSCDAGLVYGGSEDTHRILKGRSWSYFSGVRAWWLGRPFRTLEGDSLSRRVAKRAAETWRKASGQPLAARAGTIPAALRERISAEPRSSWTEDLLPSSSPFSLRFAPDLAHLAWRYPTSSALTDYRLFRIVDNGRSAGYVVLRAVDGDGLVVAHADADSVEAFAGGILKSLCADGPPGERATWAVLNTSHSGLADPLSAFGFVPEQLERPFALGTAAGPVDLDPDTSNWLVHRDWADIGFIAGGAELS